MYVWNCLFQKSNLYEGYHTFVFKKLFKFWLHVIFGESYAKTHIKGFLLTNVYNRLIRGRIKTVFNYSLRAFGFGVCSVVMNRVRRANNVRCIPKRRFILTCIHICRAHILLAFITKIMLRLLWKYMLCTL